MNTHWRDQISWIATAGITGWEDFTLTWTGSTNPTYTTDSARYCQIGKLVVARVKATYTSGGTGTWAWSLPVTMATSGGLMAHGSGRVYDDSLTDAYVVTMRDPNSGWTTVNALQDAQSADGLISQTSPFTWASPDVVSFALLYEAA